MIELFGSALVTFLVIIDPPGCAPFDPDVAGAITGSPTAGCARAVMGALLRPCPAS